MGPGRAQAPLTGGWGDCLSTRVSGGFLAGVICDRCQRLGRRCWDAFDWVQLIRKGWTERKQYES